MRKGRQLTLFLSHCRLFDLRIVVDGTKTCTYLVVPCTVSATRNYLFLAKPLGA